MKLAFTQPVILVISPLHEGLYEIEDIEVITLAGLSFNAFGWVRPTLISAVEVSRITELVGRFERKNNVGSHLTLKWCLDFWLLITENECFHL